MNYDNINRDSRDHDMNKFLQDRWTVLSYDTAGESAKGRVSESWLCVDCGVNTAPGFKTRKETELDFALHGTSWTTAANDQEVYCLTDKVWRETGLEGWGGCLCIGCCEKRIGRRLKPKDFQPDHPFNSPDYPATKRLRKRRGRGAASGASIA
jgi:hypothetical protein